MPILNGIDRSLNPMDHNIMHRVCLFQNSEFVILFRLKTIFLVRFLGETAALHTILFRYLLLTFKKSSILEIIALLSYR
jgi:hypothetical protein